VGLYKGTVSGQYVPCILPQEHGNKTDVRRLSLTDDNGAELLVEMPEPLECSASHFKADDLFRAFHTSELKPRREIILNVDFQQRGLGTGSCGPQNFHEYVLTPGEYCFSYVGGAIDPGSGGNMGS